MGCRSDEVATAYRRRVVVDCWEGEVFHADVRMPVHTYFVLEADDVIVARRLEVVRLDEKLRRRDHVARCSDAVQVVLIDQYRPS